MWNLDFLRFINLGICLPVSTLTTLALDVAVGIYPLLLMLVTYVLIELYDRNFTIIVVLWKPFGAVFRLFHRNWNIRTSLIDSFTTFLLLSSVKFMSVSFDLLLPVRVSQLDSTGTVTQSWYLYFDGTVPYFSKAHLPYAVLAISVLLLFAVLPSVVLFLYPFSCFQKFLNLLPIRRHILHTFMDSFQGCYQDGTRPGTRDYRWFASIFFLSRFLLTVIWGFTLNPVFLPVSSMVFTLLCVLLITLQPFKHSMHHFAFTNAFFILFVAFFYNAALVASEYTFKYKQVPMFGLVFILSVAALSPLFCISMVIFCWLYSHRKFEMQSFCAWKRGYEALD